MNTIPTVQVRGVSLCVDPAREPCFTVVHRDIDMHEYADMSEISRRERLHRHMNNEIGSLEIAAQMLVDFPDAPWELRMQLARQCWDESRHVTLLHARLVELGGHKGEFPVSNFEWCLTNTFDTLVARLAVQNRTFEAGQMDILGKITEYWREVGDHQTADMLDAICADEIQHVRFANQWIRRLVAEDRRLLLRIATAMMQLARANEALAPEEGERNAVGTPIGSPNHRAFDVNVPDRMAADFSEEEVQEVLRQAGFRSIIPAHYQGGRHVSAGPAGVFGPEPARDPRFEVRERWDQLANFTEGDARKGFEFLHRQMNEEVNGLENSARCLADFPDADWDLRMQMARQCADEARHVEMFRALFEKRGGHAGQYPVTNFQYRIIARLDSLVARLAVQNRSFEADGIDAIRHAIDLAHADGDDELAALFDAQLADEINHVRFANDWIRRMVERSPVLAMKIARGLHEATLAFRWAMQGGEAVSYQVDAAVRGEAGFGEEEVAVARELVAAARRLPAATP